MHSDRIALKSAAGVPLVGDVMAKNPATIAPDARLSDAVELMKAKNIHHLPVMRGQELVGLLSERHVRDAMPSILLLKDREARNRSLYLTHVEQVCIKDPTTVAPGDSVLVAIAAMRRVRGGSVPVLDQGRLVGILTSGDLITLLEQLLAERSGG
jgi:acetoin utilization protein AcuB